MDNRPNLHPDSIIIEKTNEESKSNMESLSFQVKSFKDQRSDGLEEEKMQMSSEDPNGRLRLAVTMNKGNEEGVSPRFENETGLIEDDV